MKQQGLTLQLKFKPSDNVWILTDKGAVEERVIRIKTEHRSELTDRCVLSSNIVYVLANGLERRECEVYASKEELKNAI